MFENQTIIARGDCTEDGLGEIYNRLERLLGERGAYIDDIVYCSHHLDKGFKREVLELKFECEWRKPKPVIFFEMTAKYNIELSKLYMIGVDKRDIGAGTNAGWKTVYLGNDMELQGKADMSGAIIKLHCVGKHCSADGGSSRYNESGWDKALCISIMLCFAL